MIGHSFELFQIEIEELYYWWPVTAVKKGFKNNLNYTLR